MHAQRPEKSLRFQLRLIPRLSASHWLFVPQENQLAKVFGFVYFVYVCFFFVFDFFKLAAFKEISVKLIAEHELKK